MSTTPPFHNVWYRAMKGSRAVHGTAKVTFGPRRSLPLAHRTGTCADFGGITFDGEINQQACCDPSCSPCGGPSCSGFCCTFVIIANSDTCNATVAPPCVLPEGIYKCAPYLCIRSRGYLKQGRQMIRCRRLSLEDDRTGRLVLDDGTVTNHKFTPILR